MASKFQKYVGVLDPWTPEPAYQERVEEVKKELIGLSPTDLARRFKNLSDEKDRLEEEIKSINLDAEAVSQLIVSALTGADLNALELESGMKVSLDIKPYVSVLPEQSEAYNKWCQSKVIKPLLTLNAQKRDSIIKEFLETGRPLPAWTKVFLKTRAKLTGKKKEQSDE